MAVRVVPHETVPAKVYRILLPHERRVITVRFHPAVVTVPLVVASGGLIAAIVLSFLGLSTRALEITWSIWLLAIIYGLLRTLSWLSSYFVVTRERIILVTGFLRSDVSMLPLSAAARLRLRRSVLGKLFGYGQLILQDTGVGRGQLRVNFLPYPEQLYIEVGGLIFPNPGSDD
jgi:hypothetical protein